MDIPPVLSILHSVGVRVISTCRLLQTIRLCTPPSPCLWQHLLPGFLGTSFGVVVQGRGVVTCNLRRLYVTDCFPRHCFTFPSPVPNPRQNLSFLNTSALWLPMFLSTWRLRAVELLSKITQRVGSRPALESGLPATSPRSSPLFLAPHRPGTSRPPQLLLRAEAPPSLVLGAPSCPGGTRESNAFPMG